MESDRTITLIRRFQSLVNKTPRVYGENKSTKWEDHCRKMEQAVKDLRSQGLHDYSGSKQP